MLFSVMFVLEEISHDNPGGWSTWYFHECEESSVSFQSICENILDLMQWHIQLDEKFLIHHYDNIIITLKQNHEKQ